MMRYLDEPITASQRNQIKRLILRCLTGDFEYGRSRATGKPLKKPRHNMAIYDKQDGHACWTNIDLDMVMDKVVLALSFAMDTPDAPVIEMTRKVKV